MSVTRNYGCKDVDMLIASKTIVENFGSHKATILAERPIWADPFIGDFNTRIDNAFIDILGLNPRDELKSATRIVVEIQDKALKDLSFFKVQVEEDFSSDKKFVSQVLKKLGFDGVYSLAQKKDQQALTQVLARFGKGMTKELKTTLTTKGINPLLIDRIQGYAGALVKANVTQESLKGSSKSVTAAGIVELNEIYSQTKSICRICSRIFVDDPVAKKQFAFNPIVAALGTGRQAKDPAEEVEAPPVAQAS